ncbi:MULTISPECIES: putative entry exclusion protein TrbK-alt [unclassified Bradyrhizobium]|uniref:putative entry exclusion protein TrbK-alt n=1 Tax=unclassified Bradyrhizobium TaxID=2631580 RepID=UPI000710FD70|nr:MULTISPECIES: putative entry exclusion protein TrbK-alt [unclassified Bradyrhizobium]KQT27395.1 conjugal transfer protein TrbK [Bradyrhizobium sp. Leaf396]
MDGKVFARVGAVGFVAVAITATAIEMTRKEEAPERWPSGRAIEAPADPLRDALIRCQALGEEGPRDPECRRAWAENRHRFLAPGARPAERLPDMPPAPRDVLTPQSQRTNAPTPMPPAPSTPQLDEAR